MNYLSHKEFGIDHKHWNLPIEYTDPKTLNYWIEQWYLFYKKIYEEYSSNQNYIFFFYEKLTDKTYIQELLDKLEVKNVNLKMLKNLEIKKIDVSFDQKILNKSCEIYKNFYKTRNN